ncbi:hypothetical protein ACCS67_34565, partial [Rhizobium brockwellii]
YSLNPVMRIGEQITETYRFHQPRTSTKKTWQKALDMLEAVQIRDPERVARLYPHEISGGMGQRALIAMMDVEWSADELDTFNLGLVRAHHFVTGTPFS